MRLLSRLLENVSSVDGISGWEARLSWDESCYVNLVSISGNAMNVEAFPNFVVGFGEPVAQDSLLVLATFNVIATAPGGIYIHKAPIPSIPDAETPLYVTPDETCVLMEYSFGEGVEASASWGVYDCPEVSGSGPREIPPRGWITYDGVDPSTVKAITLSTNREIPLILDEDGFLAEMCNSEMAFRGRLENISFNCCQRGKRLRGIAGAEFTVLENFWNAIDDRVIVHIEGVSIPNCVKYTDYIPRPQIEDYSVGQEYLIATFFQDEAIHVMNNGILRCNAKGSADRPGEYGWDNVDPLHSLRFMKTTLSLANQS